MPYREQLRLLSAPVDLIVATPGRLLDHLERGSIVLNRLECWEYWTRPTACWT